MEQMIGVDDSDLFMKELDDDLAQIENTFSNQVDRSDPTINATDDLCSMDESDDQEPAVNERK